MDKGTEKGDNLSEIAQLATIRTLTTVPFSMLQYYLASYPITPSKSGTISWSKV